MFFESQKHPSQILRSNTILGHKYPAFCLVTDQPLNYFQPKLAISARAEVVKLLPVSIILTARFCSFCKRSFSAELQHPRGEQQLRKYGSTMFLHKLLKVPLPLIFL